MKEKMMERITIEEHINILNIAFAVVLFFLDTVVFAQEMRIWNHGHLTKIDTGIYVLPEIPDATNIRYIEMSDFVVEVFGIKTYDTIVDSIMYRVGGYPGKLTKVPAKIAEIEVEKVFYRFTLDSINGVRSDFAGYDYFPDSLIKSIKYILLPVDVEVPDTTCLLWCDLEYKDCLVFREVVTEEIVFVNQFSDYCGYSTNKKKQKYSKLSELLPFLRTSRSAITRTISR